ncbi:MAG: glycosyltransferase family 2 protein [Campylobacterales bacterium]|nr:glycosyltransferase family 2 protein [Campylobacterales bacterium]
MQKTDVVVVVPTFNNPQSIEKVAQEVLAQGYWLIIVDDGSSQSVASVLSFSHPKMQILRHETNRGKGAAIITGAKEVRARGKTFFASMDGDGQHLAGEIEKMLVAMDDGQIIIGARNLGITDVPNGSKFGRWFSNFWACWDTDQEITDSLSGFRVYPVSILELPIKTERFDWEMEVLVRHAWKGGKIKEVSVECYYPRPEERVSHFKKFWDTAAIVMVHVRLLPRKFFFGTKDA